MKASTRSIATLLVGSAALLLGNGLLITLLPIRAQIEGFSAGWIGLMGAAHFAGFAAGCILGPLAVKQVGHIRAFAGFAALTAAAVLLFPLAVEVIAWTALRASTGLCLAVLYMVIESWLNDQAHNEVRGQVLSIYIIVTNLVTLAGQLTVNLADPGLSVPFILVAILVCLSLVPIALTDTPAPRPITSARLRILPLYRLSPTGFIGCLAVGLIDGAFWTLGPVFAQGRLPGIAEITYFMGAFVVGGTLSQWPLGRLSDRIDRRWVIAGCSLGTIGTGLLLGFQMPQELPLALALAGLHGAVMFPLYPLCLAHANDHAPNEALVEVSSGLLLVYAAGAICGPLVVGPVMGAAGGGSLFLAMSSVLSLLALFILYRALRQPIAAVVERVSFVPVPKTSASIYELEAEEAAETVESKS